MFHMSRRNCSGGSVHDAATGEEDVGAGICTGSGTTPGSALVDSFTYTPDQPQQRQQGSTGCRQRPRPRARCGTPARGVSRRGHNQGQGQGPGRGQGQGQSSQPTPAPGAQGSAETMTPVRMPPLTRQAPASACGQGHGRNVVLAARQQGPGCRSASPAPRRSQPRQSRPSPACIRFGAAAGLGVSGGTGSGDPASSRHSSRTPSAGTKPSRPPPASPLLEARKLDDPSPVIGPRRLSLDTPNARAKARVRGGGRRSVVSTPTLMTSITQL